VVGFVLLPFKPNNMKLFVAAVPYDFDDVDLREMFELYGDVHSAKVILDKQTGKSRGFGFVDMPNDADARTAIETLDGAELNGKKMTVKQAEEQPRGDWGANRGRPDGRPNGRPGGRPPRRF
jgi:cold-inducible RNA-binding protein